MTLIDDRSEPRGPRRLSRIIGTVASVKHDVKKCYRTTVLTIGGEKSR